MLSLSTLPVEILLAIIDQLTPSNEGVPIVGVNAAWTGIYALERPRNFHHLATAASSIFEEGESQERATNNMGDVVPYRERQAPLRELRQTSHQFNDLCVPVLYSDLNFVHNNVKPEEVYAALPYASHARTVRIVADPAYVVANAEVAEEYAKALAVLLKQCSGVTSVSVYYHYYRHPMKKILEKIAGYIFYANVESIGIYSIPILRARRGNPDWNHRLFHDGLHFLRLILDTPRIMENLKHLEVVMETMQSERYTSLKSKMAGLSTLSIRRAFRTEHQPIWSTPWPHSSTLRRLNLIDCANAYAAHIPMLVQAFPALRYLMVSTCGNETDEIPSRRHAGWSRDMKALHQTHSPLEEFHVEHMNCWEILALGVIPTKKLIMTNIVEGELEKALLEDRELFPMVQNLHVDSLESSLDDAASKKLALELEELCKQRKWALHRDAKIIRGQRRRRRSRNILY
ncbi:hypothetical protein CPB86DRAFT_289450 [Serendipita vermifera]|nr:hypothetical protein CPB86DRAFT_289450 [Serendipita vermifera]